MLDKRVLNTLFAFLLAQGLLACAAEVGTTEELVEDEAEVLAEPIINGFVTTALPAVGRLSVTGQGGCTATLISSRVILTAAHCFGFNQSLSLFGNGTLASPPRNSFASVNAIFYINNPFPPAGQAAQQQFSVRRVFVVGTQFGEKDLAIAEIDSDVNAQYAPPIGVASSTPPQGANVTGYGYGCTVGGGSADGQKRQHGAAWQTATYNTSPSLGCPGDSGGPIIYNNKIVAVFSYGTAGVNDVHARPVTHRATIDRVNAIYGNMQVCTTCPIISLKTSDNQHYLQAPNNGSSGATINANPTAIGEWEQFRFVQFASVVPAPPSWIALQARSGRWVGAAPNTSGQVKTNRGQIWDQEMFFMENRGLGKWSLKTNSVTKYLLTAENGGGGTVSSNRTVAGPWETFAFPFP